MEIYARSRMCRVKKNWRELEERSESKRQETQECRKAVYLKNTLHHPFIHIPFSWTWTGFLLLGEAKTNKYLLLQEQLLATSLQLKIVNFVNVICLISQETSGYHAVVWFIILVWSSICCITRSWNLKNHFSTKEYDVLSHSFHTNLQQTPVR